jgi:hypothetical protein
MQTRLAEPGWKALRMLSLDQGRPLQQLVLEGLNDLLKKYGKDQVVTGPDADAKWTKELTRWRVPEPIQTYPQRIQGLAGNKKSQNTWKLAVSLL